ncbi:hypothetical protein GCM10017673_18220 [Streptosporangium violaceochromogenes]|nr:hypothetical protein GCM10017673_18220 [Streptosporangium violaceochromogenes]
MTTQEPHGDRNDTPASGDDRPSATDQTVVLAGPGNAAGTADPAEAEERPPTAGRPAAPAHVERASHEDLAAATTDDAADAKQLTTKVADAAMGVMDMALSRTAAPPQPLATPSTDFSNELNNIDFRKMIGGPLQAAVDAQVASALATVDFITKVGFTTPPPDANGNPGKRELVMVDFSHTRKDLDASGSPAPREVHVRVPLLAMLPIPSLRIEQVVVDFNVKLNSVESASTADQLGVNAELKAGWGPVSFKVSASYQRNTSTNVEVKKEYSLNVNVKAVQDEMPAGLERILNMLSA